MLIFILSFLIPLSHAVGNYSAQIIPGYGAGGSGPGEGGGSYAPSVPADYSAINGALGSLNHVLNGGSTGHIRQAAEARSNALESGLNAARASIADSERRAAEYRAQASSLPRRDYVMERMPALPSPEELIARAPRPAGAIDLTQIPDPSDHDLPEFQAPPGAFRDEIIRQYKDLYKIDTPVYKRSVSRDLGLSATTQADSAYSLGELDDANFYKTLGKTFLDLAVGIDPVTGFGRSAFELCTGRNMITGVNLSSMERGFAFLGVMTAGIAGPARTAGRMFHIFDGAARLLGERQAFQAAVHEGRVLAEKVGHLLPGMMKHARITAIHTAENVNQVRFPHYGATPPFELGSYVVELKTLKDSQWARVHCLGNQAKEWVVRRTAIEGLTAEEIARKFAIPILPTHVSDVHIPNGTTLLRGNIHDHGYGASGAVQYWIDKKDIGRDVFESWFKNARTL